MPFEISATPKIYNIGEAEHGNATGGNGYGNERKV